MTEKSTLFNLYGLSDDAKIRFRHAVGKPLNAVTPQTAHCYYAAESGFGTIRNEDLHFAILCLACLYEDVRGQRRPVEYILHDAIKNGTHATLEHRVDNLLMVDPKTNPYEFMIKLSRILIAADAIPSYGVPNWDALYNDLCMWSAPVRPTTENVKRKWIKTIYF